MSVITILDMNIEEFIADVPFKMPSARNRALHNLKSADLHLARQLLMMNRDEIECIEGISESTAKILFTHLIMLRGSNLKPVSELKQEFEYLETNIEKLNEELGAGYFTSSIDGVGIRSGSIIELVGEPGIGKTKLCQSLALQMMKYKKNGGWNKRVLYFDSSFESPLANMRVLNDFHKVSESQLEKNLFVSNTKNLDEILTHLKSQDPAKIGMVIIDNISQIIANQYPTSHFMGIGRLMSTIGYRDRVLHHLFTYLRQLGHYFGTITLVTNSLERHFGHVTSPEFISKLEYSIKYFCSMSLFIQRAYRMEQKEMQGVGKHIPSWSYGKGKIDSSPISIHCTKSNQHRKFRAPAIISKYGVLGCTEYNNVIKNQSEALHQYK
ncbi:MAG: DNA repair and recombination protein RadA [Candidatus Heimdallarchaeota archaeon LC_2]|nr:MAG: DNA repair and recombination protein RadA [Candidatus Heimdallarchaeota archaeon LC_2]